MQWTSFYTAIEKYYSLNESKFLYQYINREKLDISWYEVVDRLVKKEPIDYILGHTFFLGYKIFVTRDTLIPRPETEELVEWILKENKDILGLSILDIGTGSGCIAKILGEKIEKSKVVGIDVSENALEIAKKNVNELVELRCIDILDETAWNKLGQFDIIVSNPPYISEVEKTEISNNVIDYEPSLALFVPEHDTLIFYKKILQFGLKHLNTGGVIYFETHQNYQLKNFEGYEIISLKDMSGNRRFLKCSKII